MKKKTKQAEQLKKMYSVEDGRLQGRGGWKKFPFFWFLLFLSYKCTRRCAYCYSYNQVGDENEMEMDDRTFSRLLDWIPEVWKANKVKVNAIGFLGGEPLLRTDRIQKVMDSVFRNTDGMQGTVYTNADLVDTVHWEDLEGIQWMSVNMTDLSIEELSRRMKIIQNRSNVINQTITGTLDDFNLERVIEVSRFGMENGYRLRYYRDLYKGLDEKYHSRLLKKYHELCDLLEDYAVRGFNVHTTFLLDILVPLWDSESSPYPCGKRLAKIFPDGSVGPCIRNQSFKSGTIFDPDPMTRINIPMFHYDVGSPGLPDECRTCEWRSTCQGGCPNDRLLHTGTTAGKSLLCEIHKEIIPRLRHLEQLKTEAEPGEEKPEPDPVDI